MYYEINEDAARRAKEANSFNDYVPGSATDEYRSSVDSAAEIAEKQKKLVDQQYHQKIDSLLDTYARKLADNMNNSFVIDARVPSVLIAGPSNFPVKKKEKQNAARDKNMEEWRYIQGLLDKIRSTGTGGISSDDANALEKLEDKLKGLEESQELMKAVNAYYRKNKTLDGCPGLSDDNIRSIQAAMKSSYRQDPKPFEPYELSNNNANMRRIKERISEIKERKENPPPEGWSFDGGQVVMNAEANRVQILFDDKPDEETRAELKSRGFRWAPSQGAWQRQLNKNGIRVAKAFTEYLEV